MKGSEIGCDEGAVENEGERDWVLSGADEGVAGERDWVWLRVTEGERADGRWRGTRLGVDGCDGGGMEYRGERDWVWTDVDGGSGGRQVERDWASREVWIEYEEERYGT